MLFTKGHQDLAFPPTRGSFTQALSRCFDPLIPKTTVLRGEITAARAASSSGFLTAQPPASTGLLGGSLPTTILPKSRTESACVGLCPIQPDAGFRLSREGQLVSQNPIPLGSASEGSAVMLQNIENQSGQSDVTCGTHEQCITLLASGGRPSIVVLRRPVRRRHACCRTLSFIYCRVNA